MGTIVVGKIEAGHLKKGQQVVIMPNKVRDWTLWEDDIRPSH